MTSCAPIPCPEFQEVELEITGVCDCADYIVGSKGCPIHGERVIGYEMGWNAATKAFKEALQMVQESLPGIGVPQ